LRKELKRNRKIYFYDLGIRNALISNFKSIEMRDDVGKLWENYCLAERIKHTHYNEIYCSRYFWRTTDMQEIDYIEERDGTLYAYEFKWNERKKTKLPEIFTSTYSNSETHVITRENFEEFIY
jgi:uncharacterized protein